MNLWTDCEKKPITELLTFIVDNRGKTVPTSEKGHILIATNCVKNDKLFPVYEKVRFLSEETYNTFFRAHPIPGDIIFVNKGTPGRVCLVPDPIDFCIAQDMIALRANKDLIDNHYLLAVLRSEVIQKQIYNTNVGDVIPHFKKQFMNTLLIPTPPMAIQKKIGKMYYDLSLKIENNNKINANLEAQAAALFKSWFVDFEPFKDVEFVESELGMIPKGWKVGTLGEICKTNQRSKSKFNTKIEYLDTGSIFSNRIETTQILDSSIDKIPSRAKRIVSEGDIIYSSVRPVQRHYGILMNPASNLIVSTGFIVITAILSLYRYFIYQYLIQDEIVQRLQAIGEQSVSTYPSINASDIENLVLIIPTLDTLSKYSQLLSNCYQLIEKNNNVNQRLSSLRDTLLPKLMSGEIDLDNITH